MVKSEQTRIGFNLHPLEEYALSNGLTVVGIDEVGRGSAFGVLVLGAFKLTTELINWLISTKGAFSYAITDSKLLDHKTRARIYRNLLNNRRVWLVDGISNFIIDSKGLGNAIKEFLPNFVERALNYFNLSKEQVIFVLDGENALGFNDSKYYTVHSKSADSLFMSVALASIIAKYTRDHLIMKKFHRRYRRYALKQHKGYLTKQHRQAIQRFGPTPLHRRSFLRSLLQGVSVEYPKV